MTPDGPPHSQGYQRLTVVAWAMQALIVLSGAAVRLTEAGLGCEDWPTCNDDELLPEWELHGLIEFGNRVISGFVAVSAIAALVGAYRLAGRRPDLIRYSWGLVAGTLAQVVLGGITVLADLHPIVVSVHFLLSMVLLWAAQMLWNSARLPEPLPEPAGATPLLARLQLGLAGLVLLTGTVVTGTGPNSGDSRADRLDFQLTSVVRVHSVSVWLLIATVVILTLRILKGADQFRPGPAGNPRTVGQWMMVALVAQGAVGYTQFALGVPAGLVELHILGAIVVWTLAIQLWLTIRSGAPTTDHATRRLQGQVSGPTR